MLFAVTLTFIRFLILQTQGTVYYYIKTVLVSLGEEVKYRQQSAALFDICVAPLGSIDTI